MARTQRAFPANNIKIAVGSFTGNGTANTNINIGFKPKIVLIKRVGGAAQGQYFHDTMPYATSGFCAGSAEGTGHLLNLANNGFTLDSGASINPNGSKVNYIAFAGKPEAISTGVYVGNATDNRNIVDSQSINHTPSFVFIKQVGAQSSSFKVKDLHGTGDLAGSLDAGSEFSDRIQNFQSNGFQIGANVLINTNLALHRYWTMSTTSEFFASTTYVGNGTSTTFTLPFEPDCMIIKCVSGTNTGNIWFKSTPFTTYPFAAVADLTDGILSYDKDPKNSSQYIFNVGSNARVNENGVNVRVFAFKAGDFIVPFTRTLV